MTKTMRLAGDISTVTTTAHAVREVPSERSGRVQSSTCRRLGAVAFAVGLAVVAFLPAAAAAQSQCMQIDSGLRTPVRSLLSSHGNLLVAESGDGTAESGRISIFDRHGNRRTLIDGLPSAPADVGTPSGPSGLYRHGQGLFVVMGTGDTGIMGPRPGTTLANPDGPSSPIFSSVLTLYFSASTERRTTGFTMTPANQASLAQGKLVALHDRRWNFMFAHLLTNFPEYVPSPLPDVPGNISLSNPFGITGLGNSLYVTDGGRNLAWKVNRWTGARSELVAFSSVPNPLFPQVGGPFVQAVPTGITELKGKLLVSLLRGAPFPTGVSTIERVDPRTGNDSRLISNLTTAIETIPLHGRNQPLLVLEMSAHGPFFSGPGRVLRFDDPALPPQIVADCLASPTSMTLDRNRRTLYVTEEGGNLVGIPYP